jgi:hypothetical protein
MRSTVHRFDLGAQLVGLSQESGRELHSNLAQNQQNQEACLPWSSRKESVAFLEWEQ